MKFLVAVPGATGLPEALGPLLCGQTAWIALFNECTVQSSCDFTVLVSVAGLPREVPCMKRQHASFEDLKRQCELPRPDSPQNPFGGTGT